MAFSVLALLFILLVVMQNLIAACTDPDKYQGKASLLFFTAIFQVGQHTILGISNLKTYSFGHSDKHSVLLSSFRDWPSFS